MSAWSRALDELVRERGSALFGYAYVLTGDVADADDLVQDALVRTFRSRHRLLGLDATHAYVKRAITTAFVDRGRRAAARPRRADADLADAAVAAVSPAPDHAPAVAAHADLHAAILALPPRERACIVLRYLEDLPVAGVAAELGLAVGTVKRYLSDAVATLRATCADIDFDATHESSPLTITGGTR